MGASKSSVSTNLNLLLKLGKIDYFTLPGDRKKYYRPTPFSQRFDNYLKMIAFEKKIIEKMHSYRQKTFNCETGKYDLEKIRIYEQHILDMEQLILKSINDFKELEKNDPI
jgi:DNA-binding transcriptional regulator GbsR (MarR family)